MFSSAYKVLRNSWWGVIPAYLLIFGGTYLAIWAIVEPLAVQDRFQALPDIMYSRGFYHILLCFLLAAHITLVIAVIDRRQNWRILYANDSLTPHLSIFETNKGLESLTADARNFDPKII